MSAVKNRRVEYRNSFSPGASPAAKLARWSPDFCWHSYERIPGGTRVRKKPLLTKLMVVERLEPLIRVSEDGLTDLTLGPSLCSSCP